MGYYGAQREAVAHNINQGVALLGGEETVEGLDSLMIDYNGDHAGIYKVGDGTAQLVQYPDLDGVITIAISPTSQTNGWLWEKWQSKGSFTFAYTNSEIPDMGVSAQQCEIQKCPVVQVQRDPQTVEWKLISPYIKTRGGNFNVIQV